MNPDRQRELTASTEHAGDAVKLIDLVTEADLIEVAKVEAMLSVAAAVRALLHSMEEMGSETWPVHITGFPSEPH